MAFRTLTRITCSLLLLVLVAEPSMACFGPKLFVAAGKDTQQEVLYALVTLYVEEKTGVESTRVIVEEGQDALSLLTEDKADLVFAAVDQDRDSVVFHVSGMPSLVTGPRPVEDLQFTTVLPAISKLERQISADDIALLVEQVRSGEGPVAAARKFFMERRWI